MTPDERHALAAAHEELRAMIRSGDPQRYHEINEAFHSTIYAGAHKRGMNPFAPPATA
jgi:DNA-binding GntR family transcriptional regulator